MSAIHGVNYGIPTLDLNFSKNKSLIDTITGNNLITFTRSTTGTYVGSDGLIKSAAVNEARFDHNPSTGESLGLLVEEARTNLLQYSQDITDAAWGKSNATVTKETLAGPAGTVPYDKITLGTFTGSSGGTGRDPTSTSQSVFYTASIYVKAGTCRYIGLVSRGYNTDGWGTYFDLETGVVTQNRNSTTYSIIGVGNGWYRLSIGRDAGTGGGGGVGFSLIPLTVAIPTNGPSNTIQPQYNGNGESLYVWAPQYEAGLFPTSYIPTTASTVTRAADVASITGTNFSSWYRQDEGTIFTQYKGGKTSPYDAYGRLASTETWSLEHGSNAFNKNFWVTGGNYNNISSTVNAYTSLSKFAASWQGSTLTCLAADSTLNSSLSGTITFAATATQMALGRQLGGVLQLNGTFSRLTYYPIRLQNSQLQQLTK